MKLLFALTLFFCSIDLIAQDLEFPDSLPINKIQQIGSHNSYRKTPYKGIINLVNFVTPFYPKKQAPVNQWEYSHIPLDSQFQSYHIRSIEIDIYHDPQGGKYYKRQANAVCFKSRNSGVAALLWPGFKVLHIADLDYNTNYYTLNQALHAIRGWSKAQPSHYPIIVMLETKEEAVGDHVKIAGFQKALKFDQKAFMDLKKEIEDVFTDSTNHILKPDDVRGNSPTLRDAIAKNGFPKLGACRGKIIFIVMGNFTPLKKDFPNFQTLPYFFFSNADSDEAAFVKLDDPVRDFDKIKDAVGKGLIVRTRADADTKEAQFYDYTPFYKAKESGAQMISTDFYKPFKKTGYIISRDMLIKK